ncbi:Branched-chain amino acid transport protein (AzlD) [Aeromicrobium marinum DSM 15272]|uniref:Branched-chain amino acid transport protein (AzlD) n=1 Tax=Aeromicrobium marinum DSM 15272 TaxID=585531 RepID=E2SCN7_9ACTN|nr:AzlD domain-containing protein [Aeromicrobium marinum]EFQ82990.1 Branched-chain amino acid transport protein (AzlD) [Aeromicrobium marinum DSM 15272]
MTTVWWTIAGCIVVTAVIKGIGPLLLGDRELPPWFARVVVLMAPALLAALVVTSALADGRTWQFGADTVGVAAAGIVVWRGGSAIRAVIVAVVVTALLRAVG